MLNETMRRLTIPPRIAALPVSDKGFPVPWFAATLDDGTRDFRVVGKGKFREALRRRACWICGQPTGRYMAFVIGPMCAVNRVSAEPPSHLECARFAAVACPFLVQPRAKRNEADLPADTRDPPGVFITRNPGVCAVWVTKTGEVFGPSRGLIRIGDPEAVEWYARGRPATRSEIVEAMRTGLPALRAECDREPTEDRREAAHRELDRLRDKAEGYLPREAAHA